MRKWLSALVFSAFLTNLAHAVGPQPAPVPQLDPGPLRSLPPFATLTDSQLATVAASARISTVGPGEERERVGVAVDHGHQRRS